LSILPPFRGVSPGRPATALVTSRSADPVAGPDNRVRALRADARKKREAILVAAEEAFAEKGVSVPVDDVASRAGVGVGTLYRHFPTKEALIAAVVATRLEDLCAESRVARLAPDPGAALFAFAERMGAEVAVKHDLADALAEAGIDIKAEMADVMEEMRANVEALIARAQQAGAVRDDVAANELFGLVVATCTAAKLQGLGDEGRRRMIAVVFDGLGRNPQGT
jgi:AcrR family transcriptional regulator